MSAWLVAGSLGAVWAIVIVVLRALKSTSGAGGGQFANLDVSGVCVSLLWCVVIASSQESVLKCICILLGVTLLHYLDKHIPRSHHWPARAEPRLPLSLRRRRCVWSRWSLRGPGTLGCESRLEFSAYRWS